MFINSDAFLGAALFSILVWVQIGYTYETANSLLPPLGDVNQVYCLEYTAFCSLGAQKVSKQLFNENISHRAHRGRDEIGEIGRQSSALSAGRYSATLYVMVNIVKGGGRAHPTLTSLS